MKACLIIFLAGLVAAENTMLARARQLKAPVASATTYGETEHADFWEQHADLLRQAWIEYSSSAALLQSLPTLDNVIDDSLAQAVQDKDETVIKRHWQQSSNNAGIFQGQLFKPDQIYKIRAHLDAATNSGIPTRRPNGMNRYGLILDDSVDGAFYSEYFTNQFYNSLIDDFVRPIARLLMPEYVSVGDDVEAYGFTISYSADTDTELKEHSDASLFTLNVNLNLPDENDYQGSSLYFINDNEYTFGSSSSSNIDNSTVTPIEFTPGSAVIHRGIIRHAALPIKSGKRYQMVIWLMGQGGYVRFMPYEHKSAWLTREQRWGKSIKTEL